MATTACAACWSWFPRRSAIDAEATRANDGGMSSTSESADAPPAGDRREFLKSAACVALGGTCLLAPAATGVYVLLAPLGKKISDGAWVPLTKIEALAVGAGPRLFQVFVERTDAWTRHPRSAVGAVFLERLDEKTVRAFQSACPHLGCAVEWRGEDRHFFCPCHNSAFERDGAIIAPSPAARGLDTLEVEIREGEVWVQFRDFKAGKKEKVPVA